MCKAKNLGYKTTFEFVFQIFSIFMGRIMTEDGDERELFTEVAGWGATNKVRKYIEKAWEQQIRSESTLRRLGSNK